MEMRYCADTRKRASDIEARHSERIVGDTAATQHNAELGKTSFGASAG